MRSSSVLLCIVFFFKQKTAYEMRMSDWSSDVCSSDLFRRDAVQIDHAIARCHRQRMVETGPAILHGFALPTMLDLTLRARPEPACGQLRRASAHAAADIVAGDSQVPAVVVLAAQNDMPVEPGTERSEERRGGKECVSPWRNRW